MCYEVHGVGPPLVLLHGGTGSIPDRWIPLFSAAFQVIAPEQMGHGRTADVTERPFHYHALAEDTVELTRQLGLDRSFVVGYSDGGIIGLDIALHHPERVIKLAITGTNARTDGYTSENLDWIRTFDPNGMDAPDTYRACHRTVPNIGQRSSSE
jgi:pimeloyl-ACP methyl ester carboxylesterase